MSRTRSKPSAVEAPRAKRTRAADPARRPRPDPTPLTASPTDGDLPPQERKERVLHTRVPQSLDRQLRRRALNLGMSVSTVVRHVLLNTFGLVEDIVTDSTNVALSIAGGEDTEREQTPSGARARMVDSRDTGVVGWQEAILNLNAVCDRCNAVLPKGSRAAIGVRERPGPRAILCEACLRAAIDADTGDEKRPPRRRAARGAKR